MHERNENVKPSKQNNFIGTLPSHAVGESTIPPIVKKPLVLSAFWTTMGSMSVMTAEQTPKQKQLKSTYELFISAYLLNNNATKSAIEAGYSVKTAHSIGSRLLRHPIISAELERRKAEKLAVLEQKRRFNESFTREDALEEALKLYEESEEKRDKRGALELASRIKGYLSSDVNVNLNLGLFTNAAQELSSITSEHSAIRAELAPPASELKRIDAPAPQAQAGNDVNK